MRPFRFLLAASAVAVLAACASSPAQTPMGFFVTSVGTGKGADLGGLAGADAHCQRLAALAGAGSREWRAYLSVPGAFPSANNPGTPSINARDRIGTGPWYNAKGDLIARDVNDLHGSTTGLNKQTALDERGNVVKGRGDQPNEHDMLTGSRDDGTAFGPHIDTTCKAWTSSTDGSAIVGHHDRNGPLPEKWAQSWNFSHPSAGCSQEALVRTGGSGRFYCFAAK
jgi:hypothetical protein